MARYMNVNCTLLILMNLKIENEIAPIFCGADDVVVAMLRNDRTTARTAVAADT